MDNQLLLFAPRSVATELARSEVRVLTWNIANPSLRRAQDQLRWLLGTEANVIMLTEARRSAGSSFLANALRNSGFRVFWQIPSGNEYSVVVAEKGFRGQLRPADVSFLPERIQVVTLPTFLGELTLVAIYVPSRGPAERRNADKRAFQTQIAEFVKSAHAQGWTRSMVIGGDLNVIPRDHQPPYSFFGEWEYQFYDAFGRVGLANAYESRHPGGQDHSWVGRREDGYRFDHLFVSSRLLPYAADCRYLHEPRHSGISDHSALQLRLTVRVK